MSRLTAVRFLLAGAAAAGLATAAAAQGLETRQTVSRIEFSEGPNGETVRSEVSAETVAPGDRVRYQLSFSNAGAEPASAIALVMPIPAETVLIEGTPEATLSATTTYSVDQGVTFAPLDVLEVASGELVRPARAGDVTHVRWAVLDDVAPSATGSVAFEAQVR